MTDLDLRNRAQSLLEKIEHQLKESSSIQSNDVNSEKIVNNSSINQKNADFSDKIFLNNNSNNNLNYFSREQLVNSLKDDYINNRLPQLHHNYIDNNDKREKVKDLALIEVFYGTEVSRILATTKALQLMLKSNPIPKDFIFIEAQTSKSKAVFGWLKDYKVKYFFKKIEKQSNGLFLKTALWNIGASLTTANKLCFVDADTVFCNQNWLSSINLLFDSYDVLSLAGYNYYENCEKYQKIYESIGHVIMSSNETKFDGHIGFNIGMTRDAYKKYGKFEAFSMHDDIWIWHRIVGTNLKPEILGWTPYKTTDDMKFGLPFKIGSSEECMCHLKHNSIDNKYELYGYLSYFGTDYPFEDIIYDKNKINNLPIWSNCKNGNCIKIGFDKINKLENIDNNKKEQAEDILLDVRKKIYGEIDEQHPLIVMTAFVTDFKHKNIESILKHKEIIQKQCCYQFTYICFTNEKCNKDLINNNQIDIIPFSSVKVKNNRSLWKNEMYRKDIKLPKNSIIIWIDINEKTIKNYNILKNDSKEK